MTAALEETVDQFHRVLDMKADFTEVTALRADNAELGSQLIAVADDVRSMISSSDREIREQVRSPRRSLSLLLTSRTTSKPENKKINTNFHSPYWSFATHPRSPI